MGMKDTSPENYGRIVIVFTMVGIFTGIYILGTNYHVYLYVKQEPQGFISGILLALCPYFSYFTTVKIVKKIRGIEIAK